MNWWSSASTNRNALNSRPRGQGVPGGSVQPDQAGEMKDLNVIVKADVQGSAEAVKASLEKLSNDEVRVRVIHCAVGAISESDVMLAASSGAIIVGFNVRPDNNAKESAARNKVDMRMYRVIYDCIDEVETAMKGMLAPQIPRVDLGRAEVPMKPAQPRGRPAGFTPPIWRACWPRRDWQPDTVVSVDIAARSLFPDKPVAGSRGMDLAIDHHPSQEFLPVRPAWTPAGQPAAS